MSIGAELHNLITSIHDRHPKEKGLKEYRVPHVGLFYVINGRLFWDGVPVRDGEDSGCYKVYAKTHPTFWENVIRRNDPDMKEYDAYYFPRGRVVYDKRDGFYELVSDKHILCDDEAIRKIVGEMGLPSARLRKSGDVHYECACCKAEKAGRHRT